MKTILSLIFLFTLSSQITIDKGTSSSPQRSLKEFVTYLPEVVTLVEGLIADSGGAIGTKVQIGNQVKPTEKYTTTLNNGATVSYTAAKKEDTNSAVMIEFKNEIEKGVLELENVDLESEKAFITDKYVKPFINDSNQILPDAKIQETVKKAITGNPHFEMKEEAGVFKLTEKDETDETKKLAFIVKVIPGGGGKTSEVEIHSSYFTSSFLVNIKTEIYIMKELEKTLENALIHAKRMQNFNTSDRDQITHEFNCEMVLEAFQTISGKFGAADPTAHFEDNQSSGEAPFDNGDRVQFQCLADGPFLKVDAGFAKKDIGEINLGAQEYQPNIFHQGFIISSLYDLIPVAESFFEEVYQYAKKALGLLQPSDQTPIFSDA